MSKVCAVTVLYNSKKFIEPVFSAVFSQTHKDLEVWAVIAGNGDNGKELLQEKFPRVKIVDPGYNIGFAKGHNLVFGQSAAEFFQLVNPDLIMEPNYIEEMLKVFDDPKVGAATGKLFKWDTRMTLVQHKGHPCVIDTTGITINKSGRAYDRGQHEIDRGQYDNQISVAAVSAAGAMYRKSALESAKLKIYHTTKYGKNKVDEYFDEDFHSYWEDVDLAWRMTNAGWQCAFVPPAIAWHGRGAGSSEGGYKKVFSFIRFHRALPPRIRRLNYKNHILMYVKNSRRFYPQFFVRELAMLAYVIFFEIGTLKVLPEMVKLLPKIWKKRKAIQRLRLG